jgi:hypothetical protein
MSQRASVGEARNIEIDRVLLACNNVNFLKACAAQHRNDGIIASGFALGSFIGNVNARLAYAFTGCFAGAQGAESVASGGNGETLQSRNCDAGR